MLMRLCKIKNKNPHTDLQVAGEDSCFLQQIIHFQGDVLRHLQYHRHPW